MNMFRAFMELESINEEVQYCWFGYYLDKDGNKKIIYATKDSTSHDATEGAEELELLIPEPYTKFVFRGTVSTAEAEKEGWTLLEGVFDSKPSNLSGWKPLSGQPVILTNTPTTQTSQPQKSPAKGKYLVGIVSDKGRLRAMGDDGIHGPAFVAFPNHLRNFEGQTYEVDELIWNGKNYRVFGNIVEI